MPEVITPAQAAANRERPGLGEVIIEIASAMNRQVMFGPAQERLRGRWDGHNLSLGDTSSVGLMQIPVIPGMYVTVNPRERTGSILDPLSLPENAALLAKVSEQHKVLFSRGCSSVTPVVKEDMNDDEIATWLYWMIRVVASKNARIISGELPESEKELRVLMPKARIRKDFYSSYNGQEGGDKK